MASRLVNRMHRLASLPTWSTLRWVRHISLGRYGSTFSQLATERALAAPYRCAEPSPKMPRGPPRVWHAAIGRRTLKTACGDRRPANRPAHLSLLLPGLNPPPYLQTPKRLLSLSQYRGSPQKTDQSKERRALREYERTYSAAKKYSRRNVAELEGQEVETIPEDLLPEDTFGTLLTDKRQEEFLSAGDAFGLEEEEESGEDREEEAVRPTGRRNSPIWYASQMKKLIKEGKLMDAIAMLETRMLKEDRVQPEEIHYNTLIGACGREGYTKKAFKLYNQMKKRGLTPSDVTYTGLFNACAESPWPLTDGITRLRHLHSQLQDKGARPNQIASHAMIKAYAKCGDLPAAFDLFRDLLGSGDRLSSESFAFLLFACAGDKERGFLYGIEAWHQLMQRGLKPDIYTFNLLLRVARDCGIGDPDLASRLLLKERKRQLPAPKRRSQKGGKRQGSSPPEATAEEEEVEEEVAEGRRDSLSAPLQVVPLEVRDEAFEGEAPGIQKGMIDGRKPEKTALSGKALARPREQLPNLLDPDPDLSQVHSLTSVASPADRLALLGGAGSVLRRMRDHRVRPDVKSLTLLAEMLPASTTEEERLLEAVAEYGVRVDVDFYNAIIRRRSRRSDLEAAKAVLPAIHKQGLFPNLRTYVNLACECSRAKDGIRLLKDMKEAGLKPTVHIYGALITAASRRRDYRYQTELLICMEKDEVAPNERILQKLETTAAFGSNPYKADISEGASRLQARLNHFRGFYTQWLGRMGVQETPHPWQRFRRPKEEQPAS